MNCYSWLRPDCERARLESDHATCGQLNFFRKLRPIDHMPDPGSAVSSAKQDRSSPFDVFSVMNLFKSAPAGQPCGMEKKEKQERPNVCVLDEDYLISMLGMCAPALSHRRCKMQCADVGRLYLTSRCLLLLPRSLRHSDLIRFLMILTDLEPFYSPRGRG